MKRWKQKLISALTAAVLIIGTMIPVSAVSENSEYEEALKNDSGSAVFTVYDQEGVSGAKTKVREYSLSDLNEIAVQDQAYAYEYWKNDHWCLWTTTVYATMQDILADCDLNFGEEDQIIASAGTDGYSYTLTYDLYENSNNYYPMVSESDPANMENGVTVPCVIGICWEGDGQVEGSLTADDLKETQAENSRYSGNLRLFLGSKADDFYTTASSGGRTSTSTVAGNRSVNGVTEITVIHDASYDYKIEFMSNGEKPYQQFYLKEGDVIPEPDQQPEVPESVGSAEDYSFDYWYRLDANGNEVKYQSNVVATEDQVYYPKWKKNESDDPTPSETEKAPVSRIWDGTSVDVSWYFENENADTYVLNSAADLAGAAALVNGLVNKDCIVYTGDKVYTASEWNKSEYVITDDSEESSDSQNKSSSNYSCGVTSFDGVTLKLTKNVDMSAGNYMPIGGQYRMDVEDSATHLGSSFCGTFDGGGHSVTLECDRHVDDGNFGDGQSVGLIGRLGVHDNDPTDLRPVNPTVKNVSVYGSIYANRSVGGIVGKIGKTSVNNGDDSVGGIIDNCANFASVRNTDAKGCGGICGASWNGGKISNCYNAGTISSTYTCPTGGIAGSNEIAIENCYNTGSISALKDNYAMAIGTNNGGAPISLIKNCYYLEGSAPGGGYYSRNTGNTDLARTSEYMKSEEFLTLMGESFAADSEEINSGYPVLLWQADPDPDGDIDDEEESGGDTPVTPDTKAGKVNLPTDLKNGTVASDPKTAKAGETVELTVTPNEGYEIDSVKVSDKNGNDVDLMQQGDGVWIFSMPEGDVSVAVTFKEKDSKEEEVDPAEKYKDLDPERWYYEAVSFVLEKSYFNGTSDTTFEPDGTMTRAMFVTVLSRMEGIDAGNYQGSDFSDVKTGQWYSAAIQWASKNSIVNGIGDGKFDPEGSVTREQMAAIMYRYAAFKKADTAGADSSKLNSFTDKAEISDWAEEAVSWAVGKGIINGMGDGTLAPKGMSTRAQVAQIVMNYSTKLS